MRNVGTDPNRAMNFVVDLPNASAGAPLDKGLALLQKAALLPEPDRPGGGQAIAGRSHRDLAPTGKYAGRPLTAVWAAAPYLHNDSVPTLYDLLLPAARRPVKFRRGGRLFDPVKIGYVEPPVGQPAFVFDTTLTGNHNTGHEYGTDLSEADRDALLEYLKTK